MAEDRLKREPGQGLPEGLWEAGADYLAALRKLGLDPEGLLWTFHAERKEHMLAIVSSIVDRVGPREIYGVLIQAYEKAATPQSIEPWTVTVFSPKSFFQSEVEFWAQAEVTTTGPVAGEVWHAAHGYSFKKNWIYVTRVWRAESKHQLAVWRTFQENVQRLAA